MIGGDITGQGALQLTRGVVAARELGERAAVALGEQRRRTRLETLVEPAPKAGYRRQRRELRELRILGQQVLDDALDQEAAERHTAKPGLRTRNGVEDGRVGGAWIGDGHRF